MFDISRENLKLIKGILKKYIPNAEIRVFGSRVNGKAKLYSDLDLAIVDKSPIDRTVMANLKNVFQESNLPFRIDVIDWNKISKAFQRVINENYQVLKI